MNLSENNCTGCKKYFKLMEITIVVDPKRNTLERFCDKCLEKFQEMTKDTKVAVEVGADGTLLYCYRCGLKTSDEELFMKHDCIKTESNIKFVKTLMEDKKEKKE
jgi:hypothetical protein